MWADSLSTATFGRFLRRLGRGRLFSIDADADALQESQEVLQSYGLAGGVRWVHEDSVTALRGLAHELRGRVDLLYLDAVDFTLLVSLSQGMGLVVASNMLLRGVAD